MDHHYIDQFDLVDRYLMGKLDPDEIDQFEEHFVDCPQCVEHLKVNRNFIQDLKSVATAQTLHATGYESGKVWLYLSQPASLKIRLLISCCLVISVSAVTLLAAAYAQRLQSDIYQAKDDAARWQRSFEEGQQTISLSEKKRQQTEMELTARVRNLEAKLEHSQAQRSRRAIRFDTWVEPEINVPLFPLISVRGAGDSTETDNKVELPNPQQAFLISLQLEGEATFKDYQITILDDRQQPVFEKSGLKVNPFNSLLIGFNAKSFRNGEYTLVLNGITGKRNLTVIGNYSFRVIKN